MPPHSSVTCCRSCGASVRYALADLGKMPVSNAFLQHADEPEAIYPLRALVCEACWLVQLPEVKSAQELFSADYPYFSSYSDTWLRHSENYAEAMSAALGLGSKSLVLEIASNDGYLLKYFMARGIGVLGIEPSDSVAEAARRLGIETIGAFFDLELARELVDRGVRPDLVVANNVLAHVPDINSFVAGLSEILKGGGLATLEFPHLLELLAQNQFDTIYHEHYSYLSLLALEPIFARHELQVVDVESIPTHGGSLRLHVRRKGQAGIASHRVDRLRAAEATAGLDRLETYMAFDRRVRAIKRKLLATLVEVREQGATIAGYGAPAKGNILLNYCGIRTDLLDYTVDRNPHKQHKFLPGVGIPVFAPERIRDTKPQYVLILPWNLRDEIMDQLSFIRAWGGRFIVPIPNVEVCT